MFENSGLVLRFFLLVHKPLVSKPLASKPLVSRWIVGTRLAEQTLPPRSFKALRGIFGYGFQNRTPPTVSSSMSVFGFLWSCFGSCFAAIHGHFDQTREHLWFGRRFLKMYLTGLIIFRGYIAVIHLCFVLPRRSALRMLCYARLQQCNSRCCCCGNYIHMQRLYQRRICKIYETYLFRANILRYFCVVGTS